MAVNRPAKLLLALVATASLALTACGANDEPESSGGGGEGGSANAGGSFSFQSGEPENPLIPSNTTESEGHQIITGLFAPLVNFAENGSIEYSGTAESIESTDNTVWTIKLKPGWTFQDGTAQTAESFVKAWNWAADPDNKQGASYFFAKIAGYDDEDKTALSGLKVVDDTTFEVTLSEAFSVFPISLGYTAYEPLPDAFFTDPVAFGKKPIGNGPFKAKTEWVPNEGMTLERFEEYAGENKAKAQEVEIKVIPELQTAFTMLQGDDLDVLVDLPDSVVGTAKSDFGDRYTELQRGDITALGFPTYDPRFSDPKVRKAFSMAIDREAITAAIFQGTRTPADSYATPVVVGYREDACGDLCTLNKDEANKLLDEAGFDRSKPVDLWFNAGASHENWMTAVGNQIKENLGIDYKLRGDLQFAEYLPKQDDKGMTGPFRNAWVMDYPSIENFLTPLYSHAALPPNGSNVTFYDNPEFDKLIVEANAAGSVEEATTAFQKAEDLLFESLPAAPLFYGLTQAVNSERVGNIILTPNGDVELDQVEVN